MRQKRRLFRIIFNCRQVQLKPKNNMHTVLKRKIIFVVLELILGITLGLFALSISENLWKYIDSIIVAFLFVYLVSVVGLAIPGYFYLKLYGNKEIFIGAVFSAIVWTLFAIFLYIILTFFAGITFLIGKEMGLIFPLIFGVIGFNHFAFIIKKNSNP